jgi:hypothetical protein
VKSWITESEGMLGVNERAAEKFSKGWYNIKRRQETHDAGIISMSELRAQVAETVKERARLKPELTDSTTPDFLSLDS